MEFVGTHIPKHPKGFLASLKAFYETSNEFARPVQIFTGSPQTFALPIRNHEDEVLTKEYVIKNNIQLFIHSKYIVNIARIDAKCKRILQYDLDVGVAIGSRGVILHTGKSLKMPIAEALDNSYNNMLDLDIHISCPILLETPAHQGSETLFLLEDFVDFMKRFGDTEKYGVVIDTCHVFSSSYDPVIYIDRFIELYGKNPKLIHYNDSKECQGSCKDRHAPIGTGHIKNILEVLKYVNDIPMLVE